MTNDGTSGGASPASEALRKEPAAGNAPSESPLEPLLPLELLQWNALLDEE